MTGLYLENHIVVALFKARKLLDIILTLKIIPRVACSTMIYLKPFKVLSMFVIDHMNRAFLWWTANYKREEQFAHVHALYIATW